MRVSKCVAAFTAVLVCTASAEVGTASPDLPADDACLDEEGECSVSLRQLRGELRVSEVEEHSEESVLQDDENPMDMRREEDYLNKGYKNIVEAMRDDSARGVKMDKMEIEKNIREAQTNLMHVSGCPSFLPEAKSYLQDALNEMDNREDESSRRREVHDHLENARKKVDTCKHDLERKGLLQTGEEQQEEEEVSLAQMSEEQADEEASLALAEKHAEADSNKDGEVQHSEVVDYLGGLENRSEEEMLGLLEVLDADSSSGLDSREFAAALEAWGETCSIKHTSSFCSGTTRHCCTKSAWGWKDTRCTGHYSSKCGGGGYNSHSNSHRGGSTSCSSKRVSTFCSGASRKCCCHNTWGWKACGCKGHYSSCWR